MFQILYFLQHATIESQICHGMDRCGIWIYYFFYSSFSLISLSSSPSAIHRLISTLPYSFFFPLPFCSILFSFMNHEPPPISSLPSHKFHHHESIKSPSPVFPPFLFALSSLFYLKVAYQRGSGCGFVISDYDRRGCRSLDCGFVTLDCDRRRSLGCGSRLWWVCV